MFEIGIGGPWDVAAGAVILREAGGVMTDPQGGVFDVMARRVMGAATPELGKKLSDIVNQSQSSPYEPQATALSRGEDAR